MVEIEKTASPVVTAVQQRTTEADGIVALAQLTGVTPRNPSSSMVLL